MFGGVIQKESFYIPNVVLLHSKRSPFAFQNESFCKLKGVLLQTIVTIRGKQTRNNAVFVGFLWAQVGLIRKISVTFVRDNLNLVVDN